MSRMGAAVLLTGVLLLAGCGKPGYREWTASAEVGQVAFDECTDEVDTTMRLRGYPHRPLPETPHFAYRKEMFGTCMRRKGYGPD